MGHQGWDPSSSFSFFTTPQTTTIAATAATTISLLYLTDTTKQIRCADYGKVQFCLTMAQSSGLDLASVVVALAQGPLQTTDSRAFVSVAAAMSGVVNSGSAAAFVSAVHGANTYAGGWLALSAVSILYSAAGTGTITFNDYNIARAY